MRENGHRLHANLIPFYIGDKLPSILISAGDVGTKVVQMYRLNVPCLKCLGVEMFEILEVLKFFSFGNIFIDFFPPD